jgi:uncharacterized membrane-anchored protein YitT (DUF2179 family)
MPHKTPSQKSFLQSISIKNLIYILLGISMACVGLKGFLLPNHFLDGGVTGVSLLIQRLTGIELSWLIIGLNLPFIWFGAKQISKNFAIKSFVAIVVLAVVVHFAYIPVATDDKLLIAVFGGFFLGAGIGLTIRGGAVIDGTEVLAINISRKYSLTVGDFMGLFNIILFGVSALLVSLESALYSMLTYLAASKTVDFILNGIEEYIGVMVISEKNQSIKRRIIVELGVGVTAINTNSGYGKSGPHSNAGNMLLCVVTRLEVTKLLAEIYDTDPNAFVIQHSVKDTKGGMIKKRALH